MYCIKDIRKEKGLTQIQASDITGIPLRTYKVYENDKTKEGTIKYMYICDTLKKYGYIDEDHGVLSLDEIKKACQTIFSEYGVEYAILFGSYARQEAKDESDVDLLVSTNVTGLDFYGMAEKLRETLHKRVDLLKANQLNNNEELLNNILKYGIRIYPR